MVALASLFVSLACGQWIGDAETDQASMRTLMQVASDRTASPAALHLAGMERDSIELVAEVATCRGNVPILDALIAAGARPSVFGPRALACMSRARCQSPVDIERRTCSPTAKPDDEVPMLAAEKLLLDKGLSPDATESDGTPVLVRAAGNCAAFATPLIERGADVNPAKPEGTTALMASQDCPGGLPELLLDKGARAAAKAKDGSTALHFLAVTRLDEALFTARLKSLLAKGAHLDESDATGRSPLMWAMSDLGRAEYRAPNARAMLAAGADVNHRDGNDDTPLIFALSNHCLDCAVLLLQKGAAPNAIDKRGWTPAYLAAGHQFDGLLKTLLDAGADPNAADADGATALHLAAQSPCPLCVAPLLAKGAKIEAANKKGRTALHVAVASGSVDVVNSLLAAGANPNAADSEGLTPLHLAAQGKPGFIQPLLAKKAAIEARDAKGRTPLLVAAEYCVSTPCDAETFSELLKGHADPSARSSAGLTAYEIITKGGRADAVGHVFAPKRTGPQPGLSQVTASTVLVEKGHAKDFYAPGKATDGKLNTCWCKQTDDNGIGEWLQLDFAKPSIVKALRIYPGCGESEAIYISNNRISRVEVSTGSLKTTAAVGSEQCFHDLGISTKDPVTSLRLTVVDVYSGNKYNDTCIAEVQADLE